MNDTLIARGVLLVVVANVLNCDIVVNKFEFQSLYNDHFLYYVH